MSLRDEPTNAESFQRWIPIEVRYRDFDTQGHVNNATYFTYLEQARVLFLYELRDRIADAQRSAEGSEARHAAMGAGSPTGAVPFVVANASCAYRRPITRMEPIVVGVRCEAPSRASFELRYVICDAPGGTLYASAATVIVSVDPVTGKPRALPPAAREVIERMTR